MKMISKRIIALTILIIITITTPVFAATSNNFEILSKGLINSLFTVITEGAKITLKIGSTILDSLLNTPTVQNESDFKLSSTSLTIEKGQTKTLSATYNEKTVEPTYKSSNTGIVTVDSKGIVTAKANGTATITATYRGKTASCNVNETITSNGEYKYTMSNDIKKILGNFTDQDYKLFIRIINKEAGDDEIGAKYTAATLINMVQYYYPGKSISYTINKTCIPFIKGSLPSFETAYKCSATRNAVQYALSGNDPTSSIKNYKGGNGAINWYTNFKKSEFIGLGKVKELKDSSNNVKAIAVGTVLKYNSYFTGTSSLNIKGLHY